MRIRAAATAASGFSLASHIIWITPSARAVTAAGMAPAAGELVTNRPVFLMTAAGIAAEASRAISAQNARRPERARAAPGGPSRCRPRDRRLSTVPTGQPSRVRLLVRQTLQVAKYTAVRDARGGGRSLHPGSQAARHGPDQTPGRPPPRPRRSPAPAGAGRRPAPVRRRGG